MPLNCALKIQKMVNCMLFVFYHNKKYIKEKKRIRKSSEWVQTLKSYWGNMWKHFPKGFSEVGSCHIPPCDSLSHSWGMHCLHSNINLCIYPSNTCSWIKKPEYWKQGSPQHLHPYPGWIPWKWLLSTLHLPNFKQNCLHSYLSIYSFKHYPSAVWYEDKLSIYITFTFPPPFFQIYCHFC